MNIEDGSRLLAFLAAYDPTFDRASPGTILMVEYIRWAIDNGFTMVDFLCGDETYKDRFADIRNELASFAGPRTPIGWAAITAEKWAGNARPALSRLRQSAVAAGGEWKTAPVQLARSGFRFEPAENGLSRWLE